MKLARPVTVHEAKTHLSKLLADGERAHDILLAPDGNPVPMLGPFPQTTHPIRLRRSTGPDPVPADFDPPPTHRPNLVWGSPQTGPETTERLTTMMGADDLVSGFSSGAMPVEKAEASMRLFAEKVLPTTQSFAPAEVPLLVS